MRAITFCVLAILALAGCQPIASENTPVPTPSTPAANDTTNRVDSTAPSGVAPDNTGINRRDAEGNTKTPIDQDENQADVKTTARIRERIVAEQGLSINAQNAKVITSAGKVTLRGPVESDAERDTLDRIAKDVAGEANVDNQLEVKP